MRLLSKKVTSGKWPSRQNVCHTGLVEILSLCLLFLFIIATVLWPGMKKGSCSTLKAVKATQKQLNGEQRTFEDK